MSFFAELKRRNVIRVAVFYAVSSWLVLQVADVLFGLLTVPDWTLKFVLGLLLLGFPFALVLSWVYEMTPEGVKREKDIDRTRSITHVTGQKLNISILAIGALGVALLAYKQFMAPATTGPEPLPTAASVAAPATTAADEPSVAVLPFVNMSSDAEQGYFSDGLSDTLIHVLAQVDGIKVAARTSSFAYKEQSTDVRQIATDLGVGTILEGSVQKSGNRMRIIAQLIDASDGSHLWSKTFDRSDTDIFSIQDEISREVVTALKGALLNADESEIASRHQPTLEAYNEFIKGRQLMALRTSDELKQAEVHFRRAVAADPEYALAMVNLGDVLSLQVEHGDLTTSEIQQEAELLYRRALALEPNSGEAYTSLARLFNELDRDDEAEAYFKKALQLNPNYSTAYHWYGLLVRGKGRLAEAEALMQQGARLDPLSDIIQTNLAGYAMDNGDPDRAEAIVRTGLARNPDFVGYYGLLSGLKFSQGNLVEGLRWAEIEVDRNAGKVQARSYYCMLLSQFPDPAEANACIDKLAADYPDHPQGNRLQILQFMLASDVRSAIGKAERYLEAHQGVDSKRFLHSLKTLYVIDGQYEAAREIYADLTPELFHPDGPQINRNNYDSAIELALVQQALGNNDAANTLMDAVMLLIGGADRNFGLSIGVADARVHAMRGDTEKALAAIQAGVDSGFRRFWWWEFKLEPTFAGIRDLPEFRRLAEVVEADMLAQQQTWREQMAEQSVL